MPVTFLTPEQEAQYGHYPGDPSPAQLVQYFYLDDGDRAFLATLRQDAARWGCAVQLGTLRFLGTFVENPEAIPPPVLLYMADQLRLSMVPPSRRIFRVGSTSTIHSALGLIITILPSMHNPHIGPFSAGCMVVPGSQGNVRVCFLTRRRPT